jgi:hypothetical protein
VEIDEALVPALLAVGITIITADGDVGGFVQESTADVVLPAGDDGTRIRRAR